MPLRTALAELGSAARGKRPDLTPPLQAPNCLLNARVGRNRRFATQQYSLDRLKQLAKAAGGTLNDIVIALCAGGLRRLRPTTSESVQLTPERISRGEYIVDHLASCGACHTSRQSGNGADSEAATADAYMAGGNVLKDASFTLWVPNITGDPQTGIGGWTDDEVMRAIRDGVRKDGSFMFPVMPYLDYGKMSHDDVRAVVAYLRSIPKVKQTRPPVEPDLPFLAKVGIGLGMVQHDPAKGVPPPPLPRVSRRSVSSSRGLPTERVLSSRSTP